MGLTGTTDYLGKPNTRNKCSEKTWIDDAPRSTADQGDPRDRSDDGLQLTHFVVTQLAANTTHTRGSVVVQCYLAPPHTACAVIFR